MSTYTIGEVASRSGVSASALRYYEGIGLVTPAGRTDAGYRLYDDRTVARLAFIARAKRLGCSLDQITDLVAIRDRERCGPLQRRLHTLVTEKIADARRQTRELTALTDELEAAAAQLAGPALDGPCDERCACVTDCSPALPDPVATDRIASPSTAAIACTLDRDSIPERLAEWRGLLEHTRSRTTTARGTLRIEFDDDVPIGELARLVAAEQQCCGFFSFGVTVDRRGVGLEVQATDGAAPILQRLFED